MTRNQIQPGGDIELF